VTTFKVTLLTTGCVVACLCAAGLGQEGVGGRHGRPASTNLPGHPYPQVNDDRRATFRISAPEARQVQLSVAGGRHEMTRDRNGVWAVTAPLPPGFQYYVFLVDGVELADPASEAFIGSGRIVSGIEVPSPAAGDDFYEAKNVPHGEVRVRPYAVKATREHRKVLVYTPPDYDASPAARYPVLYLQHGDGEDRRAWWRQGRVNFILDNLLAAGKVRPMIVVMADGGAAADTTDRPAPARTFERTLIDDLIPMIDATYRTIADRDHRAIAGASTGGWQTLRVALDHPDLVAHVGAFGPSLPANVGNADGLNGRMHAVFLSTGAAEQRGRADVKQLHDAWDRAHVKHAYYESPDTAHDWQTWRRSLREFAPLLFQK
jgi:enterochelin esterase family protein